MSFQLLPWKLVTVIAIINLFLPRYENLLYDQTMRSMQMSWQSYSGAFVQDSLCVWYWLKLLCCCFKILNASARIQLCDQDQSR
jgi:hypothetical protein